MKNIEEDSQSEDEECFILRLKNLSSLKLALMRKCQVENAAAGSPLCQQIPCNYQDIYYKKPDTAVAVNDNLDTASAGISADDLEEQINPVLL